MARGVVHGDIKLENVLFQGDTVNAVLDFDDYRESYLLEELTRTLMHDLDSPERNAIRSGQFETFRVVITQDGDVPDWEMEQLRFFLKARFLYDVSVYTLNGHAGLVNELFNDPHLSKVILE